MPYTIPSSADTPEQAILAVASAVKGEQVTGGDGSVNTALDILADALAGENVTVPMTDQGAILALAQYVAGMLKPEGTITITENGEDIDVAQYATADVSVSGGGGGTTDIWLWNSPESSGSDALPVSVGYIKGITESGGSYTPVWEQLAFESATEQYMGATIYGVRIKDVPVGAVILPTFGGGYTLNGYSFDYSPQAFPPANATTIQSVTTLAPIEGYVLAGSYAVIQGS